MPPCPCHDFFYTLLLSVKYKHMALACYDIPTCPDCANLALPEVNFNECNIESYESEVSTVYLALDDPDVDCCAAGAIDITTPAGIEAAVTAGDLIVMFGIGDVPEPEFTERVVSKRRRVIGNKRHVLNFTIDDMSDANYEALRQLECGGQFRIWFATVGGRIFGGDCGILVDVNSRPLVLDRGEDTFERGELSFSWDRKAAPERGIDPLGVLYQAPS